MIIIYFQENYYSDTCFENTFIFVVILKAENDEKNKY